MEPLLVVIIVLAVAGSAALGIWAYLRHRYLRAVEARGWRAIGSPPISLVHGLNVPPFGLGFDRRVSKQVSGSASDGTPFSAFVYRSTEANPRGWMLTMPLPHSFPEAEAWTQTGRGRRELDGLGAGVQVGPATARAADLVYATEVARAAGELQGPFGVTVDHEYLVLGPVPHDLDALAAAAEQLAGMRRALLASPVAGLQGPTPPRHLSIYGRPGWVVIDRDDSMLRMVEHTGGGSHHQAHDIITGLEQGLRFVRLRHTWETTSTSTDSEGRTTTRTGHHEETVCGYATTFPFHPISINQGWFGNRRKFEWEAFNDRVTVRAPDARFASDVIHQRQMEYLMALRSPSFSINADGSITVRQNDRWAPHDIVAQAGELAGFFGHVPDFVWQQLGAWPRPIPRLGGEPG